MSDINFYEAIENSKHFLDFLNKLIPKREVETIYKLCQELYSQTFTKNYQLSYSEKCNLVLDKFWDSDFCSESSLLPKRIEIIEKIHSNIPENANLFLSNELIDLSTKNLLEVVNNALNIKENAEALLNDDSKSSQQKELIRQCYSGKTKIDLENLRIIIPTLEDAKELLVNYYSLLDKEQFKKQPWSEVSTIQRYRNAEAIHDLYKDIYDLCLASRQDKYDLVYWHAILDSNRFYNQEAFDPYYVVIGAFLQYHQVYSDEWKDYLFWAVKAATCQVQDKIGFIRFLNSKEEEGGSRFASTFVEWLEDIQKTKKEILLDTKIIKQHTSILRSCEGDPKWYEKIPNTKIKENRSIIECLDNLYQELIKKEWIPQNTNKELFIYRLSGQRGPYDMTFKMKWTDKPATLGKLVRCLYETQNNYPAYTKIGDFFGLKNNIAGARRILSDNNSAKEIIKLLESCGFTHVDVFENPYAKESGDNVS